MSRLIDKVIPYNLRQKVLVYLDEFHSEHEELKSHIEFKSQEVESHIRGAGLTINTGKRKFGLKEVKYLFYVLGYATLQTGPDKISAIVDFHRP